MMLGMKYLPNRCICNDYRGCQIEVSISSEKKREGRTAEKQYRTASENVICSCGLDSNLMHEYNADVSGVLFE